MDRFDRQAQKESKREWSGGAYSVTTRALGAVEYTPVRWGLSFQEAGKQLAVWRKERAAELRLKGAASLLAKARRHRTDKQAAASRANGAKSGGRPQRGPVMTIVDGAIHVLRRHPGWMDTRTIIKRLGEINVRSEAANEYASIFGTLNRGAKRPGSPLVKRWGQWGLRVWQD